MKFRTLILVGFFSSWITLSALAQDQPAAAANRQDETIQFDRKLSDQQDTIKVLRSNRKTDINRYVTEVYTLKHARAAEVLPLVLEAVRAEGGSAAVVDTSKGQPDSPYALKDGEASYIQVVAPEFQIPYLKKLIESVDLAGIRSDSGVKYRHLRVANRSAREIANALRQSVVSPQGVVTVDELTNTVFIQDSISDSDRAIKTAQFYDVPAPQVDIAVSIIELEGNDDSVLGLEWDAWKTHFSGGLIFEGGKTFQGAKSAGGGGSYKPFSAGNAIIALGGDTLAEFLNYTNARGTAKIANRTSLSALNNQTTFFSNMTGLPSYEYDKRNLKLGTLAQVRYDNEIIGAAGAVAPAGGQAVDGVAKIFSYLNDSNADFLVLREQFKHSEGIAISVKPLIGVDTINLDVSAIVNSLVDVSNLETPIIASRELTGHVNLKTGETYKLGSFDRTHTVKDRHGIPGLKDLPVLGYLFGKEVEIKRDKKVVVFLSPEARNQGLYKGRLLDNTTVFDAAPQPDGVPILAANDKLPLGEKDKVLVDEALKAGDALDALGPITK